LADATYTIYDPKKLINFASFQQYPPCDYPATELLIWTIPKFSPIVQGDGNYQLQVRAQSPSYAGTYAVSLRNQIKYQAQVWDYTFITNIYIVDPCLNTQMNSTATIISGITYELSRPLLLKSFKVMTDTFADSVKSLYSNACGLVNYVLVNKSTGAAYQWAKIIDTTDPTTKAVAVYSNSTDIIGNYEMNLIGTLNNYQTKTATVSFWLNVTAFMNDQVTGV